MSDDEIERIKMNIDGELRDMFLKIKTRYQLKTNAEAVRICITEAYRSIFGEKTN